MTLCRSASGRLLELVPTGLEQDFARGQLFGLFNDRHMQPAVLYCSCSGDRVWLRQLEQRDSVG